MTKRSKKILQREHTLRNHLIGQQYEVISKRSNPDHLMLIEQFITYFGQAKFQLHHQYQPQCLRFIASSEKLKAYFEMGCGSGKTVIFCLASLLRAYLDETPIVMIAPRLDLLRQVYEKMTEYTEVFNEFLESTGRHTIMQKVFNVSSDRSFSATPTEEELLENEAQTDIEHTVVTLSSGEEVKEALADRAGGCDLILVCNDSLDKFMAGFKQASTDCVVIFDEFHTKQIANADRAASFVQTKQLLDENCSAVLAFSATPKVNVEHGTCAELAIETDAWGVNGVWHSIERFDISAKQLRQWSILKQELKFHWGLSSSKKVEEELRGWLNNMFGVDDAEQCVEQIALMIAFAKCMQEGATGLAFVKAVPHIKAFMSVECKVWREKIEAEYNIKFYESHAGVSRERRNMIKDQIDAGVEEDATTKHVILNHSTWLMGMDFPRISWIMLLRNMESDNMVQAVSRGTRKFAGLDTCHVVLPFTPVGQDAKELIEKMYGMTEGDVKHYLIPQEDARIGEEILDTDDLDVPGDEAEIRLDHGDAEIVELADLLITYESDLAYINQLKKIARQESTQAW